jgi:hypothetical protein
LASAVPLHHPSPSQSFPLLLMLLTLTWVLSCSNVHGVPGNHWPFSPTESHYSTFDRELLASYLAVRHFCFSLKGHPLTLFTDANLLSPPFPSLVLPFPPASSSCCPSFLNSKERFPISLGPRTWLLMHSLAPLHPGLPVAQVTTVLVFSCHLPFPLSYEAMAK